jgi:hypothetical protein
MEMQSKKIKKETWKKVDGYENYEISNYGNLRSLDNVVHFIRIGKPHTVFKKGMLRNKEMCKNGYVRYSLCVGNKKVQFSAHRLVAKAFIPNPKNKPDINHKDSNRGNNFVGNLEWATEKENIQHALKLGRYDHTRKKGEEHHMSVLTKEKVLNIREDRKSLTFREIAKKYSISKSTVQQIINKKTWIHI